MPPGSCRFWRIKESVRHTLPLSHSPQLILYLTGRTVFCPHRDMKIRAERNGEREAGLPTVEAEAQRSAPSCFSHDQLRPHGLQRSMGFSRQEYWSGLPCRIFHSCTFINYRDSVLISLEQRERKGNTGIIQKGNTGILTRESVG